MERTKFLKRIKNLEKIKGIVEIAKFDTLQKLSETNKIKDHHYAMAETSKEVLSFSKFKYNLSTNFSKKIKKNLEIKTLWVFITISSNLLKTSYSKFENIILKDFIKKRDQIIPIGDPAINFSLKKKLKIFMDFSDVPEIPLKISSVLNEVINKNSFDRINIVSNTPKINNEAYTIYPVKENYLNNDIKKTKFYFSLPDILENITHSYITNTIEGIFQESKRFFYQEKLVKHESSLKNIDERIFKFKSKLNKLNRKKETEDIIEVTQISKRK